MSAAPVPRTPLMARGEAILQRWQLQGCQQEEIDLLQELLDALNRGNTLLERARDVGAPMTGHTLLRFHLRIDEHLERQA